jgi:hypothetical protein
MNAQFDYGGRVHTFRVSLGPRPDCKIGPPIDVIVDACDQHDCRPRRPARWRVAYEGVDPEYDRLCCRVIEVL